MNYIEEAQKTNVTYKKELLAPLVFRLSTEENIDLLHAALGMCTEAGEFADTIKKYIFYGKSIDYINLQEEIGDIFWYIAIACKQLGVSFEEIQEKNIEKLKKRYPDKFTNEAATNRNVENELSHF